MASFYLVLKENQIPQALQRTGEGAESQVSLTTVPARWRRGPRSQLLERQRLAQSETSLMIPLSFTRNRKQQLHKLWSWSHGPGPLSLLPASPLLAQGPPKRCS